MKKVILTTFTLLLLTVVSLSASAQENEQEVKRYKLEMTISNNGVVAKLDIDYAAYSFYQKEKANTDDKKAIINGSTNETVTPGTDFNLSVSFGKISKEFLVLLSVKGARYDGVITCTDNFSKKKIREIKFSQGVLQSFSETLDPYSPTRPTLSMINCKAVTIDGVDINLAN